MIYFIIKNSNYIGYHFYIWSLEIGSSRNMVDAEKGAGPSNAAPKQLTNQYEGMLPYVT